MPLKSGSRLPEFFRVPTALSKVTGDSPWNGLECRKLLVKLLCEQPDRALQLFSLRKTSRSRTDWIIKNEPSPIERIRAIPCCKRPAGSRLRADRRY